MVSQHLASAKKQQSIANFFTPRATINGVPKPSQSRSQPIPAKSIQHKTHESSQVDDDNNDDDDDDDDDEDPIRTYTARLKRTFSASTDAAINASYEPNKRLRNAQGENSFSLAPHDDKPAILSREPSTSHGRSKVTPRTSKYVYDASANPAPTAEDEEPEDDATRRKKALLHDKFVKKLGHPDAIALIKKRNWEIDDETQALGNSDEEDDDEAPAPKLKRKGAKTGKLTPMEIQFLDIKRKHLDAVIIIEVGYKMKFFGEDARIAARELGIVCIPGKFRYDEHPSEAHLDRFASASIPVHRLPVHAKRLVLAGHKVGVVRQIETAALKKAGDNRNTPFIRKLTNLYTKGTYIEDVDGLDQAGPNGGAPSSGFLLCITETNSKGWGSDEKVQVGILAVQPSTGDVIYDDFEDGFMRTEIETRLLHISPCEILIVGELSKATNKLIHHMAGSSANVYGDKIRIEQVDKPKTAAATSYSHVSQFYADRTHSQSAANQEFANNLLDKVLKLSEPVTIALSAMITFMKEYGLEHVFNLTKYFQSFSARSHMLLQGNTLSSLEIYHNQTDNAERGSLFWAMDRTQTRFGRRLLRKWVGRPLIDRERLEQRVAAVEELKNGNQTIKVDKLKSLLMKTKSDLERSLIRIYYGKCTRPELLTVLQTLQRISTEFAEVNDTNSAGFESALLNEAVAALPVIGSTVIEFLDKINAEAAKADDKYAFFREEEENDTITNHKMGIAAVEQDLDAHRAQAREKLKKKTVTYVTVAGIEYLVEVPAADVKRVPASWVKISGTKKLSRFHTPEVVSMIRERDQHKESLAAACDVAFSALLNDIAKHYQAFRDCISSLATLDCLLSLATVASQPGYCKPEYSSTTEIQIEEGRHPMVEQLLLDAYVPNSTNLSGSDSEVRALLITGPNMGGKSSYVRSTALICIMAQIGSYVPAASAKLGMLDAVFTRMGAFDNMMAGESTFMVELSETSDILKQATPRSLVILDELGRGTSTHDGVAIAQAVLDHVVRNIKCLTLFITHYQTLASMASSFPNGELRNVHMAFDARDNERGEEEITFLFKVSEGVAHRSYGLNVARLARVPDKVVDLAAIKSAEMEEDIKRKKLVSLGGVLSGLVGGDGGDEVDGDRLESLAVSVDQL